MARYNQLAYGSSGEDVKKMQQALANAGYNVGGVDGVYGANTQAAVRQYQQAKGLTVDGIAGDQTLGALYGSAQAPQTQAPAAQAPQQTQPAQQAQTPVEPEYKPFQYDPASDAAYQNALAALIQENEKAPVYANSYDGQLADIYDQIVNRDKFSYDLNADMLYQQYRDQYASMGELAMRDTMGQAAALTGGYGSSYAQQVGQQQYDTYLRQLNDIVPELYGMARDQYDQEGQDLLTQYQLMSDLAGDEYSKYQDEYSRWLTERDYAQQLADAAYDRGFTEQQDAYSKWLTERQYQDSTAQTAKADAIDRINNFLAMGGRIADLDPALVTASGYTPVELALYEQYYVDQLMGEASKGGGGGGGGSGTGAVPDAGTDFSSMFVEAEKSGYPEVWLSQKANYQKYGLTSSSGLYKAYQSWLRQRAASGTLKGKYPITSSRDLGQTAARLYSKIMAAKKVTDADVDSIEAALSSGNMTHTEASFILSHVSHLK